MTFHQRKTLVQLQHCILLINAVGTVSRHMDSQYDCFMYSPLPLCNLAPSQPLRHLINTFILFGLLPPTRVLVFFPLLSCTLWSSSLFDLTSQGHVCCVFVVTYFVFAYFMWTAILNLTACVRSFH